MRAKRELEEPLTWQTGLLLSELVLGRTLSAFAVWIKKDYNGTASRCKPYQRKGVKLHNDQLTA